MLSRINYTLREMWASLSRNLTLTVAAIITATVSLFLFGMTLLIQRAFDNQLSLWTGGVKMIVYMEPDATQDQIDLVQRGLLSQPTVIEDVEFCDQPCAFEVAQRLFAADNDTTTLDRLTPEKTPSFFRVVPVNTEDSSELVEIRNSIETLPKVRGVAFPNEQIDVLGKLKSFFGVRTFIMSAVLLFASALLIWNTIRTAMFARRREIEVMKLVGATNWFIRLPFMLEGLLQGLVGGAVASIFLSLANWDWTNGVKTFPTESGLEGFVVSAPQTTGVVLAMLGVGALVGAIGSATAASRFLDV
jgi:cell division transport system permease protein